MKIVVLDSFAADHGDMDWSELGELGDLEIHHSTAKEDVVKRAEGADAVITNRTPISATQIEQLPNLKYIGMLATGYNMIATSAAAGKGIPVCNVPHYSTHSVAQYTFGLLLEIYNRTSSYVKGVARGEWDYMSSHAYKSFPIFELQEKTMGIIGFGAIGQQVAKIALAFGMNVVSYHTHPERDQMEGVRMVSMEDLLAISDVVSLHCPLKENNVGMVGDGFISMMKKTAVLINTARGGLINEKALCRALNEGRIMAAGLDVMQNEPPSDENPLLGHPRCFITPHVAFAAMESRKRLIDIVVANLRAFMKGEPQNVVNMPSKNQHTV